MQLAYSSRWKDSNLGGFRRDICSTDQCPFALWQGPCHQSHVWAGLTSDYIPINKQRHAMKTNKDQTERYNIKHASQCT